MSIRVDIAEDFPQDHDIFSFSSSTCELAILLIVGALGNGYGNRIPSPEIFHSGLSTFLMYFRSRTVALQDFGLLLYHTVLDWSKSNFTVHHNRHPRSRIEVYQIRFEILLLFAI